MSDETDLFGYAPAQASLFGGGDDRMQAPRGRATPDPETVRLRLTALVAKARRSQLPWSERDARMWQIVFPNMAKWLPEEEAEQLRFAFAREMERLGGPLGSGGEPVQPRAEPTSFQRPGTISAARASFRASPIR